MDRPCQTRSPTSWSSCSGTTSTAASFTTGADADPLVVRTKDLTDNAVPSANSATAAAFIRLGALCGPQRPHRSSEPDILALLDPLMSAHPAAFGHAIAAIDMRRPGPDRGRRARRRRRPPRRRPGSLRPNTVVAWGEPYDSPLWHERSPGKAHVCASFVCRLPTDDPVGARSSADRAGHLTGPRPAAALRPPFRGCARRRPNRGR